MERKKPGKICFGSGVPRNTDPLQRRFLFNVGPGSYEINSELFKFLNKVGNLLLFTTTNHCNKLYAGIKENNTFVSKVCVNELK